jgi:sigma-E factor negative regulatory protein RseC
MIEADVLVVAVAGKRAWVETSRQSACGHCETAGACGTSLLAKQFGQRVIRLEVDNPIDAQVGDQVVLGLPEQLMLRGSLRLYLLPLLLLFAGALLGELLAGRFVVATEPWAILGGLLGLSLWLLLMRNAGDGLAGQRPVLLRKAAGLPVAFPLAGQP